MKDWIKTLLLLTGTEADRHVKEAAWHGAKKLSQSFFRASLLTIMNLNSFVRGNTTPYYPQKISVKTLKERADESLWEQEHRGRPPDCIMDCMNLTRSPASLYPSSLLAYSFTAVVWLFRDQNICVQLGMELVSMIKLKLNGYQEPPRGPCILFTCQALPAV